MNNIKQLIPLFVCPIDKAKLKMSKSKFTCELCNEDYFFEDSIFDFRPKNKTKIENKGNIESIYENYYDDLITKGISQEKFGTFGLISDSVPKGFVEETLIHIKKNIKKDKIVCDIGAGSGDYSVSLARECKIMIHCDLDTKGITIAKKNSDKNNLSNIFFLRTDYFKLPFRDNTIDFSYTIDVIERGKEHDSKVLGEMYRITKNGNLILFDCHSEERIKFTHTPPSTISTYHKDIIIKLAKNNKLDLMEIKGTGYLPQVKSWSSKSYRILNLFSKAISLPPARWLLTCKIRK